MSPAPTAHRTFGLGLGGIVAGLLVVLLLPSAGCSMRREQNRIDSLERTRGVMFLDPGEDLQMLESDFVRMFEGAVEDAEQFPNNVARFAELFY